LSSFYHNLLLLFGMSVCDLEALIVEGYQHGHLALFSHDLIN
jgi:hypothetical protein